MIIKENFFAEASKLRQHFEKKFIQAKESDSSRFVWDYFYVKDQYAHMRTPAYHYFPQSVYKRFHTQLVEWGRSVLGCHNISPPWLSYYVDGHEQNLHTDLPHGPWAFVYSLTPQSLYRGGETILLKEEILDFWPQLLSKSSFESEDIFEKISPKFNRLIVFDPRIPHGVSPVCGTKDPLNGRLVIHGWFLEPRPFIQGPLQTNAALAVIDDLSFQLGSYVAKQAPLHGTLSIQLKILSSGQVNSVRLLSGTLRFLEKNTVKVEQVHRHILKIVKKLHFEKAKSASTLTLPLMFRL